MIIGVSGKMGSGKDTVGKIIRAILFDELINTKKRIILPISDMITGELYLHEGWQIKKFADKLKDIVCLLIGCTREQLEYETFKSTELGEEWDKFQFIEAGGNSKRFISIEDWYKLNENQKGWWKLVKLTPRLLLQLLGTECGRNIIHPNIWVNALMSEYKPEEDYQKGTTPENLKWIEGDYPNWIITDVRFPNELQAIKDRGGINIRVNRDLVVGGDDYGYTSISINQAEKDGIIKPQHYSETALDDAKFDYVINNNGTIEDLVKQVKEILKNKNII